MEITLRKTSREDEIVLKNMYALYLHDLSAFSGSLRENEEGTFLFDSFHLFWKKEGVTPYFIFADGERVGFILLLEPPFTRKVDYLINDFFIYNRFRGKGIAAQAAKTLFKEKPGSYFVAQLARNNRATHFWRKVYTEMGIEYKENEDEEESETIVCQEFRTDSKW